MHTHTRTHIYMLTLHTHAHTTHGEARVIALDSVSLGAFKKFVFTIGGDW